MNATARRIEALPTLGPVVVIATLGLFAFTVISGVSTPAAAALVVLVALGAIARTVYVGWPRLLAVLILIILLVPIRRYSLPANLPFQLELYRVLVVMLVLAFCASLLVDPRTRFRRTGFEAPLAVILGAAVASLLANAGRAVESSAQVNKSLMFFLSFILVLYLTASLIRRLDEVDFLAKTLVAGGAVVALFAIVEARTSFNVFNHLSRAMPFLIDQGDVGGSVRVGTGQLRVFGPAQHPIALSAALVMLIPLAVYLARRYRQRRWMLCGLALAVACAATVSRTGIVMLAVAGLVFLWLRPQETRRLWPALLLAPIVIHFALPGTLGRSRIRSSRPVVSLPSRRCNPARVAADASPISVPGSPNGRCALSSARATARASSTRRLFARLYPRDPRLDPNVRILDNQWLGTLLETGAVGFFGWIWLFARALRRFGAEAKRDQSERGWLLASLTAGIAAYAFGMLTFDAFAFIQVTFLMFIFLGLGAALLAERPTPRAVRTARGEPAPVG